MRAIAISFLLVIVFHLTSCQNEVKEYYQTGEIKMEKIISDEKDCYRIYYKSGRLKEEFCEVENKSNGQYKIYYENGQVENIGNFSNGLRNGTTKYFKPDGQLKAIYLHFKDKMYYKEIYTGSDTNVVVSPIVKSKLDTISEGQMVVNYYLPDNFRYRLEDLNLQSEIKLFKNRSLVRADRFENVKFNRNSVNHSITLEEADSLDITGNVYNSEYPNQKSYGMFATSITIDYE